MAVRPAFLKVLHAARAADVLRDKLAEVAKVERARLLKLFAVGGYDGRFHILLPTLEQRSGDDNCLDGCLAVLSSLRHRVLAAGQCKSGRSHKQAFLDEFIEMVPSNDISP